MAGISATNAVGAYASQNEISKRRQTATQENGKTAAAKILEGATKTGISDKYGKTVGEPQLSDKAQKYYDQLKKKYGQYDFVLVSRDEKERAKANAAKYANGIKTVVLIDEDKIEKMAVDENYRKQYEGILSGATNQLQQLKDSMANSGANIKGFGMQVNDNGTTSFFAVLKKSSADQKARIEKKAETKRAEKKAAAKNAAKKAEKKKLEERIKEAGKDKNREVSDDDYDEYDDWDYEDDDIVVIKADSIEELMNKIGDFVFEDRSNSVFTESELQVGRNIDFRG